MSPAKLTGIDPVVFAVKDSHEKVEAFFVPKYARLPKEDEGMVKGETKKPYIVQSADVVTKMILAAKGDYTYARATEVNVEWQPAILGDSNIVNRFFDALNRQAGRFKAHAAELAELKQKYALLRNSYYFDKKADNFGAWKKGLEDLAAVSYQTKVTIDRDPSQWGVKWDKR